MKRNLIVTCLTSLFVFLQFISFAFANVGTSNDTITLDQVFFGTLLLKLEEGSEEYIPAPLLSSRYDIDITGVIARTTLTQHFRNSSDLWLEGIYAFPLPDGSAIDGLRMRIGDRFIEGQIKEKEKARKTYEKAKSEGKKAALLVQHRPNLFTNSVANIGPGEIIAVQITYQQVIKPDAETYTLRAPLVAAPRYEPQPVVQVLRSDAGGWHPVKADSAGVLTNNAVRDLRTLAPNSPHNPVEITVRLDAGFPLGPVTSNSHKVLIERKDNKSAVISLDAAAPADRDFVLSWLPQDFQQPQFSLFKETTDSGTYYLAMVTPPRLGKIKVLPPRNIIFVQDVSGSMSGESIEQARSGLEIALERLQPEDHFNIIFFSSEFHSLSRHLLPATPKNIRRALNAVSRMKADGGTEMLPALNLALKLARQKNGGRLTQVVFLTDGEVSNEAEMMRAIHAGLGKSRLFTVGIGSAPNGYFMKAAADMGRGSNVYINDLEMVAEQMERLFAKLEAPVLTDLKIMLPSNAGRLTPNPLPDLYAGEPVVAAFLAKSEVPGQVRITGNLGSQKVQLIMDAGEAIERVGVAKLWARQHIRGYEMLRNSSLADKDLKEKLISNILSLALDFQLISSQTSLVAVDVTLSRSPGERVHSQQIANNLPKGWDPKYWFPKNNQIIRKASLAPGLSPTALAKLKTAVSHAAKSNRIGIPKTALNWRTTMYASLLLLLIGAGLLLWMSGRRSSVSIKMTG
ncbi:MAG: marine proteobacterial sortase target protein [Acidiferrobacteraceae bacterium]|nr:marine proteobacterial sortase target protein [Alphaproteobacteria bacterium]MBT4393767.1 marine proteobacterial sortase target protein [Acidiferrobacteraceae bacterium]MBT7157934.1 marine proteobacterial sortase target protein [Rhodospirillaceae bacterium]